MSLPARDDYRPSPSPRVPLRSEGDVVSLPERRQEGREATPLPESNQEYLPQTGRPDSGANSGIRITVSDIAGDWGSVVAIWTGTPESLSELVDQASAARDGDARATAMAGWAVLVLIPRALLHLASWVLAHPLRLLTVASVVVVFVVTTFLI